ncbi:MAG TPA: hypothetical protein VGF39_17840 [Stellaceae bacterium]
MAPGSIPRSISRSPWTTGDDETEAYRQNGDDPVLQPKDRDGVVLPLDLLVTLLASARAGYEVAQIVGMVQVGLNDGALIEMRVEDIHRRR